VDYQVLKLVHVSCAIASYAMFFQRGIWMLRGSPMIRVRWVKIVPHIVDTVLLASAVMLTLRIQQYPFVNAWLTAKVLGLLVYIGLGIAAFRFAHTHGARLAAWLAAQAVFVYIVAVALTHRPLLVAG
jgi:uncharacterized membrane protein SirB2